MRPRILVPLLGALFLPGALAPASLQAQSGTGTGGPPDTVAVDPDTVVAAPDTVAPDTVPGDPAADTVLAATVAPDTIDWSLLRPVSVTRDLRPPHRAPLGLGATRLPFPIDLPPPPGLDDPRFLPPTRTLASVAAGALDRPAFPSRLDPSTRGVEAGEAEEDVAFLPPPRQELPTAPAPEPDTPGAPGAAADTLVAGLPAGVPGDSGAGGVVEDALPAFMSEYADLGIRLRGRGELGGDWTRFRPCDTGGIQFNCNPSLVPQLSPDVQFGLQVAGTISDRIHVNVDYDQTREFSAANNINIYYQGLQDEIIQRVELGDVTFRLPSSRFLTQGIPAGNFGFQASGQLGPIDFRTVWAQQKGDLSSREFTLSGAGGNQGFVQEDTLVLDDADYVRGQFFFLMDPATLRDYPHIDVLALDPSAAPPAETPGSEPIQLYRYENDPITSQQVEGYIQANAVAGTGADTVRESGWFRFLQEGVDYFVHPSGLWIALRSPLREEEVLAVTYVTQAGDTVGDYNPERIHNAGGRPTLRLLKASGPKHQPGRPTWEQEMHQLYRVSGSNDVEVASVGLTISLGELSAGRTFTRGLAGEDITFLKLLGLDEESPADQLDGASVYKPAQDAFTDQPPVSGTFVVFPTLEPFGTPPPVPSLNLSAVETAQILGADANPVIYDAADPFERTNGGVYRLTIPFRVRSEGLVSSFSLGALGIRDGSERIYLGDRLLEPRTDYIIDYDVGQITLLDAQNLFATTPNAELRATWEQKSIFQIAPTSVFGLNAHYSLGERGGLDFLGLYQSEKALLRRPQLGVEPAAITLGGVNGRLNFGAGWLDRVLERIPGLRLSQESSLRVDGEVALSLPNPNTRGDVYLDDFDATNELPLSMLSQAWRLGSAPVFRDGAVDALPPALNATDVVDMAWQHTWILEGSADSSQVFEGFFPRQIDQQINVAGAQNRESALLVSFGAEANGPFDRRRWRSFTASLSGTGTDLTKTEFLEFYVAQGDSLTLIIDLGTVSEDAMFVDAQGNTNGIKEGNGEPWGLGILDQEANPAIGEIWSDEADLRGVWGEECLAQRAVAYPVADPRANCTRGNGRRDTEDLDGDGNLDTDERYLRYVVELDGSSPYLARTREETGTLFRLYRIPIQGPNAINVAGLFTEADLRAVKQLRVTVTGEATAPLLLARMRLVGSRWIKRSQDGIVRGIAGDTLGSGGRVEVSPVSTLTEGGAYRAPPGVLDQLDDPTSTFSGQGVEFNEKSLGLDFEGLAPGERVEVYSRFPQRPRNFLSYRQGRIWALARRGDWGLDRPLEFFVKVGNDPDNFYLYRSRLTPAANPEAVLPDEWRPEHRIDFGAWQQLRAAAEEELLLNPRNPGDPPLVLWSADSTYAVVLEDRARAPNLAAVRELSMGVWNRGELPADGELWVDEFRLSRAVTDPGFAGALNVDLAAGDLLSTRISVSGRGAYFRQLEGEPSYQDDQLVNVNGTLRLDRFTPAGWGIDLPLTVSHTSTGQDPTFLAQSDVLASGLDRLRETGSSRTRVGIGFRKRTPTANPWIGVLVDGLDARLGLSRAASSTLTTENTSTAVDARLGYDRALERRAVALVPDFLGGVLRAILPAFLEDDVVDAELRWSPERIRLGSSYFNQRNEAFRYDQILALPGDAGVVPTRSPREGLENDAQIVLRPFESFTADFSFLSTRDLLDPGEAVRDEAVQPLLRDERTSLAGFDLGWETNRSLRTLYNWRPQFADFLRTDFSFTTVYSSDRNASFVERTVVGADTARALQRSLNGQRDARASVSLEPEALATSVLGEPPPEGGEGAWARAFRTASRLFGPLNLTWQDGITSRFNRDVVEPGGSYQFGFRTDHGFRIVDTDTASTVTDRTAVTASSSLLLPLGMAADVRYSQNRSNTLDTRSDRASLTRTWPDVQAGFRELPLPGIGRSVFRRVTVSSGFQRIVRESSFGSEGQQRRFQEDLRVPVNVNLAWVGSLSTGYTGTFQTGSGVDPTGDTDRDRVSHGFSVTGSFTPPGELAAQLQRPVQLALRYQYTSQRECRVTVGRSECVPFIDQLNRTLNLTLDSALADIELGLQLSFTDRQSFIGQRSGSTQFQLGFWGQFLYAAGTFPTIGR